MRGGYRRRRESNHQEPEDVKLSELRHFTDKQTEASAAVKEHKFVFMGGAMGGGKSYWLRWELISLLFRWYAETDIKGIRVGLFCEDYPAVKERHLSKIGTEFPEWLGTFHADHKEHGCAFILKPDYGGGVLAFRNLDDPSKYQSSEFAAIGVDEIPKNPLSTFRMLRTRLRWPGIELTKFICAGNPGGYPWVRQFWIDRRFPPEEAAPQEFKFVQVLPSHNPYLSETYRHDLDSLPEDERRAFRDGDWTAFDEAIDEHGYMRLLTDPEISNMLVERVRHFGKKVIAVDPGAGGDRSAIAYKTDHFAELLFCQKLKDTMQLVGFVVEAWIASGFEAEIVVDCSGLGKGVYDRLCEVRVEGHEMTVHAAYFGNPPLTDRTRFFDLKAELYWRTRQWALAGGKMMTHPALEEFALVKYRISSDRQIRIQPKSELRKQQIPSPDGCDAMVLTHLVDAGHRYEDMKASVPFRDRTVEIWSEA